MRLRDYQKHTFRLCMAWVRNPTARNTDRLVNNLRRWSRFTGHGELADYGYQDKKPDDLRWHVHYCSDRMNQGRAKAILRLMSAQLDRLFN